MTYEIIDCTLRDGGYYTGWDFSDELFSLYLDVMARADITALELGYRSPLVNGYAGRFFYLTDALLEQARATLRPDQQVGLMFNAKDVTPEMVPRLLQSCTKSVDLVRMAIPPTSLEHGVALSRAIADMGFAVGVNVMYLSRYYDDLSAFAALEGTEDFIGTISLVDSYGGCLPQQVGGAIAEAKKRLGHKIGFHGHDNISLSFANALASLDAGADALDSTVLGMGRGAGNLRTELILAHRAATQNSDLDLSHLSRLVDEFTDMQAEFGWGTNLPYMISGFADLPQADVMDWLGKRRYSTAAVVDALQNQGGREFESDAFEPVSKAHNADRVVLVGGGDSVAQHATALRELASLPGTIVVHSSLRNAGHFDGLATPQLICLPGHEAWRSSDDTFQTGGPVGFVVTPPPRFPGTVPPGFSGDVYQADPVKSSHGGASLGPVSDVSPAALALGVAAALGATNVHLAGFDGYPHATRAQQELSAEVQGMVDAFIEEFPHIALSTVIPSTYRVKEISLYGLLSALPGE